MTHLVDKDRIVAEINRVLNSYDPNEITSGRYALVSLRDSLDTLEVKEDSLGKFKSLKHITRDLKRTLQDCGYAPNLYFCDEMWHVSWISCEEGDSIKDFEGNTPEEAIDKAYNWFHSTLTSRQSWNRSSWMSILTSIIVCLPSWMRLSMVWKLERKIRNLIKVKG